MDAFKRWCKKKGYHVDARPYTGIWTKNGTRVGSYFEKIHKKGRNKGKHYVLVNLYR